jgi:DNA-binding transcriptional regulator YbjK
MAQPPEPDRRQAIAAAAAAVIARDGLPALSHRAVAREAGVPLTAVPYYYGTKEALLAAAIDHINQAELEIITTVATNLGELETVDLAQAAKAIAGLIRTLVSTDRAHRLGHLEALAYALRQDPPLDAASAWWHSNLQATRAILTALGQQNPDLDAPVVLAAAFGLYFAELTAPPPTAEEDLLARSLERLFTALDSRKPKPTA